MQVSIVIKQLFFLTSSALLTLLSGGCAFKDTTVDGYNKTITEQVKAAILKEPSLEIALLNVKTYKGVVQLSGLVNSADDIRRAGDIAAGIPGIISVKNELTVKTAVSNKQEESIARSSLTSRQERRTK